jgi:hypothetical protein
MSGFAERLVARSAGAMPAPGITVLTPRPVANFEPLIGIEREAISEPGHPATPVATWPETETGPTAEAPGREHQNAPGETPLVVGQSRQRTMAMSPDLGERARRVAPMERGRARAEETRRTDVAQGRASDEVVVATIAHASPASGLPLAVSGGSAETEFTPVGRSSKFPIVPIVPSAPARLDLPAKAELAAPTISIGKIEVQFLPQESRTSPGRPAPERTRGFVAYTRARRGEPR